MIDRLKADFPISYLCQKLRVSTSGYYDWAARGPSARQQRRDTLTVRVLAEFAASKQASGYRKVTAVLHRAGPVNRKTVASIMRELGLIPPAAVAAFKKASRRRVMDDPADLLDRVFAREQPGAFLVGDITYVRTREGWLYVATVIDLATRMVLGYATGKRMTVELVIRAMQRARATGIVHAGAVFHSDHGAQYRSRSFARFCGKHGILRSMGANMQCWDNAVAESFFSKLKSERLTWCRFATRRAATNEVASYIAHYNQHRPHQTLGYATPAETLARLTGPADPAPTTLAAAA